MSKPRTRRSTLGLLGATAAAAVAPIALGWRRLFAEAAGSSFGRQATDLESATVVPGSSPPPGAAIAGPAEEITFIGTVDSVLGPTRFIGSNRSFADPRLTGVTVDLAQTPADKIYPLGWQPHEGDDFYSRGHWLGDIGKSTWEIEFVDFNIFHIAGKLFSSGTTDPESNYTVTDGRTGRRWQLVIKAVNLSHFTAYQASPGPNDALLATMDGSGANIIGYEDRPARPGVLIVTFLEVH